MCRAGRKLRSSRATFARGANSIRAIAPTLVTAFKLNSQEFNLPDYLRGSPNCSAKKKRNIHESRKTPRFHRVDERVSFHVCRFFDFPFFIFISFFLTTVENVQSFSKKYDLLRERRREGNSRQNPSNYR